jgi:hypothetical protein
MNLDAIRAAVRPAVTCDDLFEACRIMERAADLPEGSIVAGRFREMSWRLDLYWGAFFEPADRAESLKHWLIIERRWPSITIKTERISPAPG